MYQDEKDMIRAAKEALLVLDKDALIDRLLAAEAKASKFERQEAENDKRVSEFERMVDAAKEVLNCAVYESKCNRDLISMANAARILIKQTIKSEVPF